MPVHAVARQYKTAFLSVHELGSVLLQPRPTMLHKHCLPADRSGVTVIVSWPRGTDRYHARVSPTWHIRPRTTGAHAPCACVVGRGGGAPSADWVGNARTRGLPDGDDGPAAPYTQEGCRTEGNGSFYKP